MPNSGPLSCRSSSAHALTYQVRTVLKSCDQLRMTQQADPPNPLPAWWDDQTVDLEWRDRSPNRCTTDHDDRLLYRHWVVEQALKSLLACFERLAGGITQNPHEACAIQDLYNGLRVMRGILSGIQPAMRWMWAVIPERHQSDVELPEVYEPEPESDFEKEMRVAIDHVSFMVATQRLSAGEGKRLVRRVSRKFWRARSLREKRNLIASRGKVTAERRAELERLVSDWKEITDRWEIAVGSAMHALEVLEGTSHEGAKETADNSSDFARRSDLDVLNQSFQTMNETLILALKQWVSQRNDADREQRQKLGRTLASGLRVKRQWKGNQLNKELERQAEENHELLIMLRTNIQLGSSSAHRLASEVFGSRAFSRRLGVKSHNQIRNCPEWKKHFGEPLQLTRKHRGKGLGRAISSEAVKRAVSRPSEADKLVGIATKQEAERELSRLAEGDPHMHAAAEQVRRLLDEGEVTPDHVIDLLQEYFPVSHLRPARAGHA